MAYGKVCRVHVHLKALIVEMSTSGATSRHVRLLQALQEVARSDAMKGVVQLTRAKTARWAVLLGARLVVVSRLTKKGRRDLSQGLYGRENGRRWGLETQLACEYECWSISAVVHPSCVRAPGWPLRPRL